MNILHYSKISTLTKHVLLLFMVSFMFGASIAKAKVTKPAFTERFEKRRAYKHKNNSVIKMRPGTREKPTLKDHYDKKRAVKHKGGNVKTHGVILRLDSWMMVT